ncbi:hypothetical protein LTR95_019353, partial [Oleoguttula sp. CCFEE 5521]
MPPIPAIWGTTPKDNFSQLAASQAADSDFDVIHRQTLLMLFEPKFFLPLSCILLLLPCGIFSISRARTPIITLQDPIKTFDTRAVELLLNLPNCETYEHWAHRTRAQVPGRVPVGPL